MLAKTLKQTCFLTQHFAIANRRISCYTKNALQLNKFAFCTEPKDLIKKILAHPYSRLCRYEKPIGAYLLFWPCSWGVATASAVFPSPFFLVLFFMGSWTSRSAGCIINDLFDRDFDRKVERTKTRPLASGQVTPKQAAGLLFLNLCGGIIVLSQLPYQALIATFYILPVAGLYPLAKRFTNYPQLVLGLAFNSGTVICALAVAPLNPQWLTIIPLYMSGILWTLVYDTVYAYQDIDDDLLIGVKSTAITWKGNSKTVMNRMIGTSAMCFTFMAIFNQSYVFTLPLALLGHYAIYSRLKIIDLKDKQNCSEFFRHNSYFGAFILFSIVFGKIMSSLIMKNKQIQTTKTDQNNHQY